jgi:hypothetical protein
MESRAQRFDGAVHIHGSVVAGTILLNPVAKQRGVVLVIDQALCNLIFE